MRGVSANVMCGQEGYFGTSAFQVILDYEKITQLNAEDFAEQNAEKIIENGFDGYTNVDDKCSIQTIKIHNNISGIKAVDMGIDDGYEFDM
jgi:DNA-directed RNA polymerase II subunit RPB1